MDTSAIVRILRASSRHSTPLLLFDAQLLRSACAMLLDAGCNGKVRIVAAIKACYYRPALEEVRRAGLGAEIVSNLELRLARAAGFAPADLVLNGMGRPAALLTEVAAGGGLIICDTPGDADAIIAAAESLNGCIVRVGIRMRPIGLPFEDAYGEVESKLGLDVRDSLSRQLIERLDTHPLIRLETLHCHVGSGGASAENLLGVLRSLSCSLALLREAGLGASVTSFDLGGGLPPLEQGVWWGSKEAMGALVREASGVLPGGRLLIEPGRAVFSAAGALIVTVVDVRRRGLVVDVIVDGGTNVLLPLPTACYQLVHPAPSHQGLLHIIADGVTNPANIFGKVRLSQTPRMGDRMVIGQAGAYTQAMAEFWIYDPCPIGWLDHKEQFKLTLDQLAIQRARMALLGV